jgi:phosphoenolpyruvate-protein kinase (PTS system EI component)
LQNEKDRLFSVYKEQLSDLEEAQNKRDKEMDALKISFLEEKENLISEFNSLNEKYQLLEKSQSSEKQSQSQILKEYQEMFKNNEEEVEDRKKLISSLESKVRMLIFYST